MVISMKCPICKKLYGSNNELEVLEVRDSLLGMVKIVVLGCEDCGFIGEVKVYSDYVEKLRGDAE